MKYHTQQQAIIAHQVLKVRDHIQQFYTPLIKAEAWNKNHLKAEEKMKK